MIARVLLGSKDQLANYLEKTLAEFGLSRNHPDVLFFERDSKLGIEQARQIIDFFSIKPYSAKGRGVIIEDASGLPVETQNVLLKTMEELPEEALLILGAKTDANFLPTVLSRCEVVTVSEDRDSADSSREANLKIKEADQAKQFLDIQKLISQDIGDRFEYIEKLKERQEFLLTLTNYFHQDLLKNPNQKTAQFLEELLQAEKWANANVNIRGILEYLMLMMPKS